MTYDDQLLALSILGKSPYYTQHDWIVFSTDSADNPKKWLCRTCRKIVISKTKPVDGNVVCLRIRSSPLGDVMHMLEEQLSVPECETYSKYLRLVRDARPHEHSIVANLYNWHFCPTHRLEAYLRTKGYYIEEDKPDTPRCPCCDNC